MAAKEDAELVLEARAGDRDAFAAIYDRHAPRVYDLVRSILGDPDEAADVTQDTFITAAERLGQLRDPGKLRPWLLAIARHRSLREIKRRSRVRPSEEIEVTATEAEPDQSVSDTELAEVVRAAVAGLGARDQVVLELAFRHELSGQELGEALGVTADHAYVLVNRAKEQMDRSLGALVVARTGRSDCAQLDSLLSRWDGTLTPLVRKRVARHVERCETCGDRRRRSLKPAALLGAAPAFALPAALREQVLDRVELVSHTGEAWTGEPGGFPPSLVERASRRPWAAAVAAVIAALVLLTASALRSDPPTTLAPSPVTTASTPASTTPGTVTPGTTNPATTTPVATSPVATTPGTTTPGTTTPGTTTRLAPTTTTRPAPTTTTRPAPTTTTRPGGLITRPPAPTTTTRPAPTTITRPPAPTTTTRPGGLITPGGPPTPG